MLSVLILAQTVCKDNQQMSKVTVSKESIKEPFSRVQAAPIFFQGSFYQSILFSQMKI